VSSPKAVIVSISPNISASALSSGYCVAFAALASPTNRAASLIRIAFFDIDPSAEFLL
jgi:hypothetical protein